MTKFRILLSQTAVSQMSLLNSKQSKRVIDTLTNLEENPFRRRSGVDIKKLVTPDDPPLFRLRIGDYRAIYFVIENEVRVTEIIHRSKGYKWLE
ncbi:MAG: type II toxin-antitoxin system RelE/ParE family toxin [Candidatus Thorarchaeota archaeon]